MLMQAKKKQEIYIKHSFLCNFKPRTKKKLNKYKKEKSLKLKVK